MDEQLLLRKIGTILNVDSIGSTSNFFDLGGDSLAALELTELLADAFGCDVDLQSVLAAPTFGDLFEACRAQASGAGA